MNKAIDKTPPFDTELFLDVSYKETIPKHNIPDLVVDRKIYFTAKLKKEVREVNSHYLVFNVAIGDFYSTHITESVFDVSDVNWCLLEDVKFTDWS